ncbi:MAG: type I secretion system permease/ATPase, partial [Rhodoferax sp.]|nr:type I secretion system permease/ATPase [Rhodoferax sp.]
MTANSSVLALGNAGAGDAQHNSVHADALAPLAALCAIARFHQVAADPATLVHQLGLSVSDTLTTSDVLRAAQHLRLKAKLSRTTVDRLGLTP